MSTDEIVFFFFVFGFVTGFATHAFAASLTKVTQVKNYRPYDWEIDG